MRPQRFQRGALVTRLFGLGASAACGCSACSGSAAGVAVSLSFSTGERGARERNMKNEPIQTRAAPKPKSTRPIRSRSISRSSRYRPLRQQRMGTRRVPLRIRFAIHEAVTIFRSLQLVELHMGNWTPSIVPSDDQTVYLVVDDFASASMAAPGAGMPVLRDACHRHPCPMGGRRASKILSPFLRHHPLHALL
jgi:hypothetical protein